jgi:hypothetical protein
MGAECDDKKGEGGLWFKKNLIVIYNLRQNVSKKLLLLFVSKQRDTKNEKKNFLSTKAIPNYHFHNSILRKGEKREIHQPVK